jgi:hypothetical protein
LDLFLSSSCANAGSKQNIIHPLIKYFHMVFILANPVQFPSNTHAEKSVPQEDVNRLLLYGDAPERLHQKNIS